MNAITSPQRPLILFPPPKGPDRSKSLPHLPADLQVLMSPLNPSRSGAIWLLGENMLLPAHADEHQNFAACLYMVGGSLESVLPIVSRQRWFQPPLGPVADGHPVWQDLGGALLQAASIITTTTMTLQGARAAAMSWLRESPTHVSDTPGSAIVFGKGRYQLCAALARTPAATPAKPSRLMGARDIVPFPIEASHAFLEAA